MTTFVFILLLITAIWGIYLARVRTNPKRAVHFVLSSLFYFVTVFVSFFFLAGGPS